jgi:hypothetical protein
MRFAHLARLSPMTGTRRFSGAALLAVAVLAGCDPERPVRPDLRPGEPLFSHVPAEPHLVAWTTSTQRTSPIFTIPGYVESSTPDQYRVHAGGLTWDWQPTQAMRDFAAANPGRLWIHGDEPDVNGNCIHPATYADYYARFVADISANDATAKFSPAGFSEEWNNTQCQGMPSGGLHGRQYAQAFFTALNGRARIDEWRFHNFGGSVWNDCNPKCRVGNLQGWKDEVNELATWASNHGAPLYLGSWMFGFWWSGPPPMPAALQVLQDAMLFLRDHPSLNGASYWLYDHWTNDGHTDLLHLANTHTNGSLTPAGEEYASGPMDPQIGVPPCFLPWTEYQLNAVAGGGVPPHSYSWYDSNETPIGTGEQITYWTQNHGVTIRIDVTDKYGVVRSPTRYVPIC